MNARDRLVLLLAQGLGSGRAPRAPGTFGSLLGLAWTALLLAPGNPTLFLLGSLAGIAVAIPVCSRAETLTGQHDPGSVVLDEIVALPICFATLLATHARTADFPDLLTFVRHNPWTPLLVFAAFRFFDVAKPWPVRQSQRLPHGWGVVADDLLAAAWVNVVSLAALL